MAQNLLDLQGKKKGKMETMIILREMSMISLRVLSNPVRELLQGERAGGPLTSTLTTKSAAFSEDRMTSSICYLIFLKKDRRDGSKSMIKRTHLLKKFLQRSSISMPNCSQMRSEERMQRN